jgi:lipid-binding SYLF domain-containing protein
MAMLKSLLLAVAAAVPMFVVGCSTAPKSDDDRTLLANEVTATLEEFNSVDSTLQDLLNKSVGYAVFPKVTKAGLVLGGSYGKGEVFEGGSKVGWCDTTQGTVGLQIGAQSFSQLIIFTDRNKLDDFKSGDYAFTADISAVAINTGASAKADLSKGIVVLVGQETGLMAEASVGGQRFRFHEE